MSHKVCISLKSLGSKTTTGKKSFEVKCKIIVAIIIEYKEYFVRKIVKMQGINLSFEMMAKCH